MNMFRSHFLRKCFICLASVLVCLFLSGSAEALLYDGFNNGIIDSSTWNISGMPGLFSEHDGRLYFESATFLRTERLDSTVSVTGPVRFGMEFYTFSSTNSSPAGQGLSSTVSLVLGPSTNYVSIAMGSNISGRFFQFNRRVNDSNVESWVLSTDILTGKLGLYYDGSSVYAAYSDAVGQNAPWYNIGGAINPGWTEPVNFAIVGRNGGSGVTSFQVDNMGYSSVPVPPSLLLLAPGLAGMMLMRRRFKK
jgi:hypothetical protein